MALEVELDTYRKTLPTLLDREGKFVVICGQETVAVLDTYEDALRAGYEKCGLDKPFLVRKIQEVEPPPVFFGRSVREWPT